MRRWLPFLKPRVSHRWAQSSSSPRSSPKADDDNGKIQHGIKRRHCKLRLISFLFVSFFHSSLSAQSLSIDKSISTSPVLNGYAMSYTLDQCGTPSLGFELRRAYKALVDSCPYSADEKQEFIKETQRIEKWYLQVNSGRHDADVTEGLAVCKRLLQDGQFQVLSRNLTAYSMGKMSSNDALKMNCDGSDRR